MRLSRVMGEPRELRSDEGRWGAMGRGRAMALIMVVG